MSTRAWVRRRRLIDATIKFIRLGDSRSGDVIAIKAFHRRDGNDLAEQLSRIRFPAGVLPKGGLPIVVLPPETEICKIPGAA